MSQRPRDPGTGLNTQIHEEACAWFVEMRSDELDEPDRRRFDSWLRKSPEHVQAYLEVSELWDDATLVRAERTGSWQALVARAKEGGEVVPLTKATSGSKPPFRGAGVMAGLARSHTHGWAAAVALGVCAIGAVLAYQTRRAQTYVTGIGEERILTLTDGSRVELNAQTRLRVSYSARERDIDLTEGQALFSVAKNPQRPFIVRSGNVQALAVGTQFDVDRREAGTTVTVVEGRVLVRRLDSQPYPAAQITPTDSKLLPVIVLAAGEQVTASGQSPLHPTQANVSAVTSWTRGTLVFEGTRLADVAEQFNRQNSRKLLISDPSLEDMRISGVYSSTDPDVLIQFLREQPGVKVDETASGFVISRH